MVSPHDGRLCIYRIVSSKYPPFDGRGTLLKGSRWVSPGRLVVHASETYALALLENLVHSSSRGGRIPEGLMCTRAFLPDDISQERIDLDSSMLFDEDTTRSIGDAWYDRGKTCLLWVPSVVSPYERNVLCNQRHPDFFRIEVERSDAWIDERLK